MILRTRLILCTSICLIITNFLTAQSQSLVKVSFADQAGLNSDTITLSDSTRLIFKRKKPLLSFLADEKMYSTESRSVTKTDRSYAVQFDKLKVVCRDSVTSNMGWICNIEFENVSPDTVSVSNVVPFGQDTTSVHITGRGPWDLARAYLFRPGYRPLRIILPDNAWEMGYTSFEAGDGLSVCAIARRTGIQGAQRQRYQTLLPPGGRVFYRIYADVFRGDWQNGLRLMFRDRYLYDLVKFDDTLYKRPDLQWIKKSYLMILQMAWDREFYDRTTGKYTFAEVLKKGNELFGNIDIYGIWPTWPRLGLDPRNQWDMYRDLPGGTAQIRNFARLSRQNNTRFFIEYNPWDNSTRPEDQMKGMAQIIKEVEADGVVLDTRGSSSYQLQAAADSVRKGVVMYSEGMAVPKDMPGIISGRVHNAIYLSPELNMNRLIKPDFTIFRVCDVGEDLVHRELAIAFFNGYGSELNMMRPGGRDDNYRADLDFLARTTFTLRQNNDAFLDFDWTPLIRTTADNIYVSRWESGEKTLYTVLNMRPAGFDGKLFSVNPDSNKHFVSLWNHENLIPIEEGGTFYVSSRTDSWLPEYEGTRREGSVDCIASLPRLLRSYLKGDSIGIRNPEGADVTLWKGIPSYKTEHREMKFARDTIFRVRDLFGFYEGKIVIQLTENNILKDEDVIIVKGAIPWLVSREVKSLLATGIAPDMALVPGTRFSFNVSTREDFIPYPGVSGMTFDIDTFLIDKYPVTNAQYYQFLQSSGYTPIDTARYLKNWENGIYKQGQEGYPVVYLSYEDMKAYARWAGKRLPTQAEWQLAAQGTDGRIWPWGNEFHATFCNNGFDKPTPVDAFPKGASPYGVADLVGNVWQMTNDMYFDGSYYFTVIRGGSFYKPTSSEWYIEGGPQPLNKTQIMLLVSPGFDRSSTVGFRCVKDLAPGAMKGKGKR